VIGSEAALAACRFLHDASAMLLWGAFAYLATLVPQDLAWDVGRRLQSARVVLIALAVATTVAALPLQTALIGDGWPDALNPTTIRAVLFETSVGGAWRTEALAALLVAAALTASAPYRHSVTAFAAGLLVASLTLTGHAVMHEGWLGLAHRVNDAVHVLAGGAWLGALVPLSLTLAALNDPERCGAAEMALRRFSTAGHVAVALVILSGMINTILVLGRWPTDWSSPYQAMLGTKIALVLGMVTLAIVNRYRFVPQVASHRSGAVRAIRLGTMAEMVMGLGVIGPCLGLWYARAELSADVGRCFAIPARYEKVRS
jgi:putative copper resistance protein D